MWLVRQPKTACLRLISKYEYIIPSSEGVKRKSAGSKWFKVDSCLKTMFLNELHCFTDNFFMFLGISAKVAVGWKNKQKLVKFLSTQILREKLLQS